MSERASSKVVTIRRLTMDDVSQEYLSWLNDPEVNRYLETRHHPQSIDAIRTYVRSMIRSNDQHLFAICTANQHHIGNIKLGPVHPYHNYADVAYFIGDRRFWGRGCATEAISQIVDFGFTRLGLHRIQAGLYYSNAASRRALIKNGFKCDGALHKQLKNWQGEFEDHELFGLTVDDWMKEQ